MHMHEFDLALPHGYLHGHISYGLLTDAPTELLVVINTIIDNNKPDIFFEKIDMRLTTKEKACQQVLQEYYQHQERKKGNWFKPYQTKIQQTVEKQLNLSIKSRG